LAKRWEANNGKRLDQLVTLDYNARSFQFVERLPAALLEELLDVARRIFTV
jgi:hypothetical protein